MPPSFHHGNNYCAALYHLLSILLFCTDDHDLILSYAEIHVYDSTYTQLATSLRGPVIRMCRHMPTNPICTTPLYTALFSPEFARFEEPPCFLSSISRIVAP